MAAFCDAKQMKMVIERQRQVYFITSRVAFTISLNERYGRDIMTMLLTWKDDWVRVTEDGLLTVLKYNDADIVSLLRWRGLRSVKVTGVGTNPSDPEASWVSTVNFDGETLICRREADEVRQKLRESWEGVIEAEVVYINKSSIMPEF
ncbi:HETdomain-containing protein [Colletotrichum tofieldiae]|nr:HETdomain-containing protein [Colletotrichum tofieldiae]